MLQNEKIEKKNGILQLNMEQLLPNEIISLIGNNSNIVMHNRISILSKDIYYYSKIYNNNFLEKYNNKKNLIVKNIKKYLEQCNRLTKKYKKIRLVIYLYEYILKNKLIIINYDKFNKTLIFKINTFISELEHYKEYNYYLELYKNYKIELEKIYNKYHKN